MGPTSRCAAITLRREPYVGNKETINGSEVQILNMINNTKPNKHNNVNKTKQPQQQTRKRKGNPKHMNKRYHEVKRVKANKMKQN